MRPVFHRVELGEALQQILLGLGHGHGVVLDQPVLLHYQQIARGVGRHVDAIELGGIAARRERHAGLVLDAELGADLHVDMGDGIGHGAALLMRRIGLLDLAHHRPDLGDVLLSEPVGSLLLAGISVADGDAVAARRVGAELDIMPADLARPAGLRASSKAAREQHDQHTAQHAQVPPNSGASRGSRDNRTGPEASAVRLGPCFACPFSDVIGQVPSPLVFSETEFLKMDQV
jgi:hypothetical protein